MEGWSDCTSGSKGKILCWEWGRTVIGPAGISVGEVRGQRR